VILSIKEEYFDEGFIKTFMKEKLKLGDRDIKKAFTKA